MTSLEVVNNWFQTIGLHLLIVLIVAFAVRHVGGALIIYLINHTVYNRKHGRHRLSEDDLVKRRDTLKNMLTVIWKVTVTIITVFVMIRTALPHVDLTPLFASAGIIGIALGFGAQSIIKDFLAGVFIITENQYRVGDYVEIDGLEGTVVRLTIRLTVLRAFDGDVHYITNGDIQHVTNMTMEFGKVNFALKLDPATDIEKMIKTVNHVGEQITSEEAWQDKITEAPMFYQITNITGSYIEIYVLGKTITAHQWDVEGELRRRLLDAFRKNNVKLADLPVSVIEK
ncbi:MAG TPA: mechanosensitive ion channel family protein [Candidatus Saccharimonadales bacterium]|nr:mechanosensitive ion channel family protein [Candidatus Saccharimonadales bacterium]